MIDVLINSQQVQGKVSRGLYGQMIEHAYWSVHLGLCTQLIDNGGFELDRDSLHGDVAEHWGLYSNSAKNQFHALVDSEKPYNGKHSQKVSVDHLENGEVVLQQNYIALRKGVQYSGFVFLKGNMKKLTIQLRGIGKDVLAEQEVTCIGDAWSKVEINLKPIKDCPDGIFCFVLKEEGEVWFDQLQLYPGDDYQGHRTRADMIELYKGLKPAFLRWPGGTYLIWHHWKHGIGPLENREYHDGRILKDTFGVGHSGEWDSNLYGTDEFVQTCRDCGAEPMININLKDGLQNTLDWIEYCNGGTDTKWGSLRAEYGHPEPYNVKYWVVDNEPMIIGDKKGYAPNLYPFLAARFAAEMKAKDPSIKVYVMGNHNTQELMDRYPAFSNDVIAEAGEIMDGLCVHCYYDQRYYAPAQGMTQKLGDTLTRIDNMIREHSANKDTQVFLSEYNPAGNVNHAGNLGQAIETANLFNMLERKSAEEVINMASMCQLCVNVDQYKGHWLRSAMVQIDREKAWVSPMYYVMQLYSRFYQPNLLKLDVANMTCRESPAFDGLDVPDADVVATASDDGKTVIVKAVSNELEKAQEIRFSLAGKKVKKAVAHSVCSASIFDMNTEFDTDRVKPQEYELKAEGSEVTYCLKPFEVAVIELEAE